MLLTVTSNIIIDMKSTLNQYHADVIDGGSWIGKSKTGFPLVSKKLVRGGYSAVLYPSVSGVSDGVVSLIRVENRDTYPTIDFKIGDEVEFFEYVFDSYMYTIITANGCNQGFKQYRFKFFDEKGGGRVLILARNFAGKNRDVYYGLSCGLTSVLFRKFVEAENMLRHLEVVPIGIGF